jgi:hypothetical protein
MRTLIVGILLGSLITASVGIAGNFYNSKGQPAAPSGSIQQFDYFRQRQLFIDQNHIRQNTDALKSNPCAR